jgi:hypothetical protein
VLLLLLLLLLLLFSQLYISLSLYLPSDPVCDTALCDVMFCHSNLVPYWTDRWHKHCVSL